MHHLGPDAPPHSEVHAVEHSTSQSRPDFNLTVARVRAGDEQAMELLLNAFYRGLKHYFTRHLGSSHGEDCAQQTILGLLRAIRENRVEQPERLAGYAKGIAANVLREAIQSKVARRTRECDLAEQPLCDPDRRPDDAFAHRQRARIMRRVLDELSVRDREILRRFYLLEQTAGQICAEMGLTETRFRLAKSRAKQKLADRCSNALAGNPIHSAAVRLGLVRSA